MDIGYVSYYVDNPVLLEILRKYTDFDAETVGIELTYGPDEHLSIPANLTDLLERLCAIISYQFRINKDELQQDFKERMPELLRSFRYAFWNNGYLEEDCNDGCDIHNTYSSRWGYIREYARMDPMFDEEEELEDGWWIKKPTMDTMPDKKEADIEIANPFSMDDDSLTEAQRIAKEHLFDGQIEISGKSFLMCGCVFLDETPTAGEIVFEENPSEDELISKWLELYDSKLTDVGNQDDDNYDYLVVRFDKCREMEDEACLIAVQTALAHGTKIISEYQLWKSLFIIHQQDTQRLLCNMDSEDE
ncbi:MAG: hypothetical protein IKS31_05805 [Clostridia bacterium]|nr:hypothetical protein [Clostridia bacterium]